tara:strand:+ start:3063 stop:4628 length:1566 start_codon:yes stop_codon:yes gene_type:complete
MATEVLLEAILDKIADALINSSYVDKEDVKQNQKTIRDGLISVGRDNSRTLVLYQKDIKANEEDLRQASFSYQVVGDGNEFENSYTGNLSSFFDSYLPEDYQDINLIDVIIVPDEFDNIKSIELKIETGLSSYVLVDVTNLIYDPVNNNPLNISQFLSLEQVKTDINVEQANEFLDTNIFELIPEEQDRQQQINNIFSNIENLLPPEPNFDLNNDGAVDRDSGDNSEWIGSYEYYLNNSISATQDTDEATIEESESYITRLSANASAQNAGKTIEDLRDRLNNYLKDIDEPPPVPQDERLEYENKSQGYLKFRNLNQGIIIRNTDGKFVDNLNPDTQDYLLNGFTITMWVRFLDKTSEGTLFNFGNPTREKNPFGFRLETNIAENNQRYIRLLVNDNLGSGVNNPPSRFYDSHIATESNSKIDTNTIEDLNLIDSNNQYTNAIIPFDFNEWYFILATYNPNVDEYNSDYGNINSNYWLNHILQNGNFTSQSNLGNRSKVQLISKSQLLLARGFKTNNSEGV